MRKISWTEFYNGFENWSLSVQKSCAEDLEEFGASSEVLEIVLVFSLHDKEYASSFLIKALDAGVMFTPEEVLELIGEVTTPALSKMAINTSRAFDAEEMAAISGMVDTLAYDRISSRLPKVQGWECASELNVE